jgi:tetratricopeptide (TPR) repeat protein
MAYLELRSLGKAVDDFRLAVKLDPRSAPAFYDLACAYALLDKRHEAVHSLERAIALDPDLAEQARVDEDFENVRGDEQFARLVMGL